MHGRCAKLSSSSCSCKHQGSKLLQLLIETLCRNHVVAMRIAVGEVEKGYSRISLKPDLMICLIIHTRLLTLSLDETCNPPQNKLYITHELINYELIT